MDAIAYIEKVSALPGQGVSSMFKFGFVTGILHGIIRTFGIPLYVVTPQIWKKEILQGTDKSKQAAIDYCLRAYPNVKLFRTERSRTYDDGMADALCIAEYAKRQSN
jgi:crossover junction endodeoxyribonuclease RuvC